MLLSIYGGEWVRLPHYVILNIDRGNTKPEKLGFWTGKNHMANQFMILDWIVKEEDKTSTRKLSRRLWPDTKSGRWQCLCLPNAGPWSCRPPWTPTPLQVKS
ncbi:uncharacterized protein [Macaca nemestrina]|uniref:uncharacterized protein isoform X4 n=1 Tax=Macaca nemestrina TaxID=9545 RepID=UPI0039B9B3A5